MKINFFHNVSVKLHYIELQLYTSEFYFDHCLFDDLPDVPWLLSLGDKNK